MASPNSLAGRRVVLGVTGGVAAYKSAIIARRLIEQGAELRCVMTESATEFLGEATLAAISGHAVLTRLTAHAESVSPHTDLARWADAVVVAPATAATISRIAHGLSEDALTATLLATQVPVVLAPAMHTEMWLHPATQRNIATLVADGVTIVGPVEGSLAGGDEGPGRMAEPEEIVAAVGSVVSDNDLQGVEFLVTAGGTREPIDPVRYIGNRSSGKMGHAIAIAAARRGAVVTLVTTSALETPASIRRTQVETAQQMADAVAATRCEVAVMAAAVADFRPKVSSEEKLARSDGPPEIVLEPTPDVLAGVSDRSDRPFLIGFAAETGSLDRAMHKARTKGVDVLVANDITEPGAGFAVDTNHVTIIWPDGRTDPWGPASKQSIAERICDLVVDGIRPKR